MSTWRSAAATDVGLVRDVNEDTVHVDERLAVIADGMGGAAAGEIASAIAVDEIVRGFGQDPTSQGLVRAVVAANRAIQRDAGTHPHRAGMGTTAVAIGLTTVPSGLLPVIVNVGDSRAYQLRDGALRQITHDHSVAEEWVRQGRISAEAAAQHPRRHQLTRTLGIEDAVQPDVFPLAVEQGDRVLLCSDGLSNELTDDEIAAIASAPASLDEAVARLVEESNQRGGRDNITAVLIEFDDAVAQPAAHESVAVVPTHEDIDESAAYSGLAEPVAYRRSRRFTWRTAIFFLALLGILAAAYAVMDWYAQSSYYLADDHGRIAVYHGQPGGFLWFKPVLADRTEYEVKQLTPAERAGLATSSYVEPTLKEAQQQAQNLHRIWRNLFPPPTTTTTTTTAPGGF